MTLARLTQQMRDAARELAPTQPAASSKLRSALDGMDENDLGTRMQRSSDWLRSGNFSDPAETALTSDLQKLGQQVGDAARALGSAQHASEDAALNRAMDDLSRLRDQLAGLGGRPNGQPGQPRATRSARQPGQQWPKRPAVARRPTQPQNGQLGVTVSPVRQQAQNGQGGTRQAKPAEARRVQVGNRLAGPVGNPGGGAANRDGNRAVATSTPAILASPVRPSRPSKVPTRPIRSARSTRD